MSPPPQIAGHSTLAGGERRAQSINLVIYDDHTLARAGLLALLSGTRVRVVEAAPVDLAHAGRHLDPAPDVALVAASGDGVELARRLAQEREASVLLMMEGPAEAAGLVPMLATGASGVVCRECPPERVARGIRAIARGAMFTECADRSTAAETEQTPLLSQREWCVAIELARGSHIEKIAAALCISPHTVRTHIRNIKRKLGARTSAQAVALAIAIGELPAAPDGQLSELATARVRPNPRRIRLAGRDPISQPPRSPA